MRCRLFFICIVSSYFAQAQIGLQSEHEKNHKKYWYYRSRLTNDFMKIGDQPGESIPWSHRAGGIRNSNNDVYAFAADAQSGADAVSQLGEYICVLASEFGLLYRSTEERYQTERELFYALEAFNRLDKNAEHYWGTADDLDGFFIRDDTPCNFLLDNITDVNWELQLGNSMIPTSTQQIPPGPDNGGYLCDRFASTLSESPMCKVTTGSPVSDLAMSNDQIHSVLAGCMLINRFVPDYTYYKIPQYTGPEEVFSDGLTDIRAEARAIADRIVTYLSREFWEIDYPNSNTPVYAGAYATVLSFGIAETACKIQDPVSYANSWFKCYHYQDGVSCLSKYLYDGAVDFDYTNTADNAPKFQWLLAAGNNRYRDGALGCFNPLIFENISEGRTEAFATDFNLEWGPLMRHAIHGGAGGTGNYSSYMAGVYSDYLNGAPCTGPFNYGINNCGGFIYSSTDNLEHPERRNKFSGSDWSPAEYNGLDYMFYHNLFYLLNSNSEFITDFRYRNVNVDYPQQINLGFGSTITLGTTADPITIFGYEYLTHDALVQAGADVTVRAGKQIYFGPNWGVQPNGNYHFYIQRPECSSIFGDVKRPIYDSASVSDYLSEQNYNGNTDGIVRDRIINPESEIQAVNIPDELYYYHLLNDSVKTKQITDSLKQAFLKLYGEQNNSTASSELSNNKTSLENAISVIPNPSNGIFKIQLEGLLENEEVSVYIFDMLGNNLFQKSELKDKHQLVIDLSKAAKGIYFVKALSTFGRTHVKRVVME